MRNLLAGGFDGTIHPVNPGREEIEGLACCPTVADIGQEVDLAVYCVPERVIADTWQQDALHFRSAVVFASGFAEAGGGQDTEALLRSSASGGIPVLGPNTLGAVARPSGLAVTFSSLFLTMDPREASIPAAFVTQSGSYGVRLANLASRHGLGCRYFVHTGNEVGLGIADVAEHAADTDDVELVLIYVESARDGQRLVDATRRLVDGGRRAVVLCAGRQEVGRRAAASHTDALSSNTEVLISLLREAGAVVVDSALAMLHQWIAANGRQPAPGRRVAIVSTSGGAGVVGADLAAEAGLVVPEFSPDLQARLRTVVPTFAAVTNPVDLTAAFAVDGLDLRPVLDELARSGEVDAIAVQAYGQADAIADARRDDRLPIYASLNDATPVDLERFALGQVPLYEDIALSLQVIAEQVRTRDRVRPAAPADVPGRALGAVGSYAELLERCAAAGLPVVPTSQHTDVAHIDLDAITYPVVVKPDFDAAAHKTESGLLAVGVADADALIGAVQRILDAGGKAVVQHMVSGTTELLVGLRHDPNYGRVLIFGWGGTSTELLHDVVLSRAPMPADAVPSLFDRLKVGRLLRGYRGRPVDTAAIAELVHTVSTLEPGPGRSIEFNPVIINKSGRPVVVDARIT